MFAVIFEVHPHAARWHDYLGNAKMLRPELESIDGFIENVRYQSLTREGWILSLSQWRDEKSVVRWRTTAQHHSVQVKGRDEILRDYHLRVGQLTMDSRLPEGCAIVEQRLDETETGEALAVTLVDVHQSKEWVEARNPEEIALALGFDLNSYGDCVSWDVYDAVLTPGDVILMTAWKDAAAAKEYAERMDLPDGARLRSVRIVRDYGMFERREAPQYYPEAVQAETARA